MFPYASFQSGWVFYFISSKSKRFFSFCQSESSYIHSAEKGSSRVWTVIFQGHFRRPLLFCDSDIVSCPRLKSHLFTNTNVKEINYLLNKCLLALLKILGIHVFSLRVRRSRDLSDASRLTSASWHHGGVRPSLVTLSHLNVTNPDQWKLQVNCQMILEVQQGCLRLKI